VPVRGQRP